MNQSNFTKSRVRIHPNNQPSSNKFSATNFPTVNWVIAKQPALLDPRTLRLNGTLRVQNDAGVLVKNDNTTVGPVGTIPDNGATLNNSIGVSSVFDEVNCSTLNGRPIETVRSYNRLLACANPLMNSELEVNNGIGLKDPMRTTKSLTNSHTANVEHDFSIPIEIGVFGDKLLNLSSKGFHGLQLDLLLANNNNCLQPYFYYPNSVKTSQKAGDNYNYEIKNLSLTYEIIRPSQEIFNAMSPSGILPYQTITSLHSTLIASDSTLNLRFGASNVLSVLHSMIPSIHINNQYVDSFAQSQPQIANGVDLSKEDGTTANIRSVQYMRAGELFPYNFMLDSEAQIADKTAQSPQAQLMNPYLHAANLYQFENNKLKPMSNIGLNTGVDYVGDGMNLGTSGDPSVVFGLGVCMDSNRQGVDFKNREYAVRIQSELNDTTANAFFTFARIRNISQYSPTGVNVIE